MDALTPTTPVQPAQNRAAQPAPPPGPEKSETVITSDFDTFLVMLTAQIQNQDPLNPIDSTDYAVQLATFSGVEQQVQTNDLLKELVGGPSGMNALSELAGWVGMDARVEGQATLSGDGVDLSFDAPLGLRDGKIMIRSESGELVSTIGVSGGDTEAFWDGRNTDGARVTDGAYTLSLTGKDASGNLLSEPVFAFARIKEVRQGPDGAELHLSDGRVVTSGDITALREGS